MEKFKISLAPRPRYFPNMIFVIWTFGQRNKVQRCATLPLLWVNYIANFHVGALLQAPSLKLKILQNVPPFATLKAVIKAVSMIFLTGLFFKVELLVFCQSDLIVE